MKLKRERKEGVPHDGISIVVCEFHDSTGGTVVGRVGYGHIKAAVGCRSGAKSSKEEELDGGY